MAYSIANAQMVYDSARSCPDCLRQGQAGSVVLSTWLPTLKQFHHSEWYGRAIQTLCAHHDDVLRDLDAEYSQMLSYYSACPSCTADPGNCGCRESEGGEEYIPF